MTKEQKINRYLAIVRWAEKRYAVHGIGLITYVGGSPSTYLAIEKAAARRYLDCAL